jgi:hypothetical protein
MPAFLQGQPEAGVFVGQVAFEPRRLGVGRPGLEERSQGHLGGAEDGAGQVVVRPRRQGGAILHGGPLVPAEALQGQGEIDRHLGVVAPRPQRRATAADRAIERPRHPVRLGEIGTECRRAGPPDYGLADLMHRLLPPPLLAAHQAEQVGRIGLDPIPSQDCLIGAHGCA